MNGQMKKKVWLGIGLFLLEWVIYIGLSLAIKIGTKEAVLLSVIYFSILWFYDHYDFAPILIWQEIVQMIRAHALYLVMAFAIGFYLGDIFSLFLLLKIVIITGLMYCVIILLGRKYRIWNRKRSATRLLIYGAGKRADEIKFLFDTNGFMFINPVAYVDLEPLTGEVHTSDQEIIEKIISIDEVEKFIADNIIDEVFIIDDALTEEQLQSITNFLHHKIPVVKYRPTMKVMQPYNTKVEDFDGNLFISVTDAKKRHIDVVLKRMIDIAAGIAGCLVLIPLTVLVKVKSLRAGDKESIFFTQDRIGKNGKIIKIYKYRSMVPNAERVLEEMMANNEKIREEYLTNKKLDPDPRITKIGGFLRRTSLDEFPQFINVLRGEMSFIGPRPYLPREIADMGQYYETVIKSKPGITGMWQANGRSDVGFTDRCKLDEYYYDNWSIWLDMIIIVKTIKAVLKKEGAV